MNIVRIYGGIRMMKAAKIAISLPKEHLKKMEHMRKKLGLQRSAFIDKAVCFWMKNLEEQEMVSAYLRGYQNQPEPVDEIKAMESSAAEAFKEEGLE